MSNLIEYRNRRAAVQRPKTSVSRKIATDRTLENKGQAAAPLPQALINQAEFICDQTMALLQTRADSLGMPQLITARKDWTWRTFAARWARSKGGAAVKSFRRSMDYDHVLPDGPHITLRMARIGRDFRAPGTVQPFEEYKRIAHLPDIGSTQPITMNQYVAILVAHEMAHAVSLMPLAMGGGAFVPGMSEFGDRIQRMGQARIDSGQYVVVNPQMDRTWGPHEACWQAVYSALRSVVVGEYGIPVGGATENTMLTNTCMNCGATFQSAKLAKTCGARCRVAASRKRKAEATPALPEAEIQPNQNAASI